jgi:predicted  nucleic acid-binding Zn-ribbon protein
MNKILSPMQKEYVTKNEFSDFKFEMRQFRLEFNDFRKDMYDYKKEMYDFTLETARQFDFVNQRLDSIKSEFVILREDTAHHMEILREGFREDLKMALEFLRPVPAQE